MSREDQTLPSRFVDEKVPDQHVEWPQKASAAEAVSAQNAAAAENAEHQMTVWESVINYKGAVAWSLIVSMCIVMEGYDLALVGNLIALQSFRERFGTYVDASAGYQISASWQSAVTQAPYIGAFIGVLIASPVASRFGYRWTLLISLIFMIGAIFIVFFANSLGVLFAGQFLSGIPWGAFSVIPTAYASEVAPIRLRAILTTYVQLCWCMGQFVSSGVIYGVQNVTTEWAYRIPFALQWVWPLPLLVIIYFAPESPWWLVRKGRLEDAAKTVSRLGRVSKANTQEIVDMMVRTNKIEQQAIEGASFRECFKGAELRRTLIVCVTHAGANLTGLLVSNLGTYFFTVAGIASHTAFGLGLANTGIQFLAVLASVPLSTKYGRRTLVLGGLSFNCMIMLIMGILGSIKQTKSVQYTEGVMVIIIGLQWGLTLGPMCWTIVGETSSLRLRAMTIGLSRDAYYLSNVSIGILNTYMLNPTGFNLVAKTGFVYLGTCFGLLVTAYFCLPELKGRSYREANILFNRRVPARKFATTEVGEYEEE